MHRSLIEGHPPWHNSSHLKMEGVILLSGSVASKRILPAAAPVGFYTLTPRASKQGFGEIVKSQWGGLKYDVQRRTQALWNCCYLLSFIPVHLSLKYPGLLNDMYRSIQIFVLHWFPS